MYDVGLYADSEVPLRNTLQGFEPRSDSGQVGDRCTVTAYVNVGTDLETFTADYSERLQADPVFTSATVAGADLPIGPAWVVNSTRSEPDGLDAQANYAIDAGSIWGQVSCWGPARPDDNWASIAGTFESLLPKDTLALGWPDVPLTEQQSWERISSVPGIAKRQLVEIAATDSPDLPWYVVCKDRAHEVVPLGENGWNLHSILRAIDDGHACWATRNFGSSDWDYSDWTTPVEAALVKADREQYHWRCLGALGDIERWGSLDPIPPTPLGIEDLSAEDRWIGTGWCLMDRLPESLATGQSPTLEMREPVIRKGEGDSFVQPMLLTGSYEVSVASSACRSAEFTLRQKDDDQPVGVFSASRDEPLVLTEGVYVWETLTKPKNAKKPCRWSATLTPVAGS